MSAKKITDSEFIELIKNGKTVNEIARDFDMDARNLKRRRAKLEIKHRVDMTTPVASVLSKRPHNQTYKTSKANITLGIENGIVIVFSDAHFWPGIRTTAFKGLLWAIESMEPKAVICNGDAFDGASISRFPRIGWDNKPSIVEELRACKDALGEIEEATKKARYNARLVWALGNHDARFENRLAANAPEFEGVKGFTLKDHFPDWEPCWAAWPTEDIVVKHRWKGGVHATHNNTINSGKTIVTGHLHSLKVTPFADYNGNRYGVDTGTLADLHGPQFEDYLEASPVNWRSGFAILTIKDGELLWPEIVHKWNDSCIEFRGQIVDVSSY
jgi:hypothetical protein